MSSGPHDFTERLRAYQARSLLSAMGVAVGVASLVFLVNLATSLFAYAVGGLERLGARTLFISPNQQVLERKGFVRPLMLQDVQALRFAARRLEFVAPAIELRGGVRACGEQRIVRILGVIPIHQIAEGWRIDAGRFITDQDVLKGDAVAVLGARVSQELPCLTSGSALQVSGRYFSPVGRLAPSGDRFGLDRDNVVLIPLSAAERLYGPAGVRSLTIMARVREDSPVEEAATEIRRILGTRHSGSADGEHDFVIRSQTDLLEALAVIRNLANGVVFGLLGLSLVVASIGVANSLLTAVMERTSEIGLRRAVGATRRQIRMQFFLEGAAISASGSLTGALSGLGALKLLTSLLGIPLVLEVGLIALAIGSSCALGCLAVVWPAVRAGQLSPVEALRYE